MHFALTDGGADPLPPENTARSWQDIQTALIDLSLCRGFVTIAARQF
jgi:hypothetical protein